MGVGFYLVPETSRLRSTGADTRPVLLRATGIIAVCALPCLLIFWLGAHELLTLVFGPKRAIASSALLPLGAAFSVLAGTYLAVQYMLALRRSRFLIAIGLVAAIEPVLLLQGPSNPAGFATVVLGVQLLGAVLAYGLALRPVRTDPFVVPAAQQPTPGPVLQAPELDRSA
jgi:O-antigen/teichoic acid export membrane protein